LAALVGSLLLLPVLRIRGHYAAVVTIAFALLFKTFLRATLSPKQPAAGAYTSAVLLGRCTKLEPERKNLRNSTCNIGSMPQSRRSH
jgi:hypothetical protein